MAMTGPPPKDPDERRRRNADPFEPVGVQLPPEDQPDAGPRTIPPKDPNNILAEWHPDTVRFWEVMAASPQAKLWLATDWWFLADTLKVYERWCRTESETGYVNLERAVRARTSLMGVTMGDRLRNRMKTTGKPQQSDGSSTTAPSHAATGTSGRARGRDSSRFRVIDGTADDQ